MSQVNRREFIVVGGRRIFVGCALGFSGALGLSGCGGGKQLLQGSTVDSSTAQLPQTKGERVIEVTVNGENVVARFPDGRTATDLETIGAYVQETVKTEDDLSALRLDIREVGQSDVQTKKDWTLNKKIGSYWLRIQYQSNGWVNSSCFARQGKKFVIALQKDGAPKPIFDLHFLGWMEGRRPCAGCYLSDPFKKCGKICGPNKQQLVDFVAKALIAIGIAATLAYTIANIVVPLAIAFGVVAVV